MAKLFCQICMLLLLQIWSAIAGTTTYHLVGKNTATVVTGPHQCCNGHTTDVTFSVNAVLFDKNTKRTNFGSSKFTKRMDELDKRKGDQKGHILASVFGGPAEIWNLAPQADNVNQRITKKGSTLVGWYECENYILKKLESRLNLPVRAKITLTYEAGSCRPTYWSIDAGTGVHGDNGCQGDNIINGFGGPFTCSKH